MKKVLLFLFTLVIAGAAKQSIAQKQDSPDEHSRMMDSLHLALSNAKQDTMRMRIYFALCDECNIEDNLKYAEPLIKLLDKLIAEAPTDKKKKHFLEKKADAYQYIRVFYVDAKDTTKFIESQQMRVSIYREAKDTEAIIGSIRVLSNFSMSIGNFNKGMEYCRQALAVAKEMNYKKGVAGCLYQIAEIYKGQGENGQALENYRQSTAIYTELKDTLGLAQILLSEGDFYSGIHNISKALDCYNKSISLYEIKKVKQQVRRGYSCLGGMYSNNNDFANALVNYQKCMSMSEEMKDIYWIGITSGNMATIYLRQGYLDKALDNNIKALKIFRQIKEEGQKANAYRRLADTYLKLKEYNKAKLYIDSTIEVEKRNQFSGNLKGSELLATEIDSARGDNKGALEHYKQYIFLSNKLKSEEVHLMAQKEKYQNEYDKQKAIDKTISDNEIDKQKIVRNSFVGGFALMILLAGVSYRNFRRKKKDNLIISHQKELVEEKQKEITDSIQYAKRIQYSLLAHKDVLDKNLADYFVLFLPKDIVSGDFYWAVNKDNSFYLAICDSTGHGVPGAFMSLLNISYLNEAVIEKNISAPGEIFNYVRQKLTENTEGGKDGMDATLVRFKQEGAELKIEYASANNKPLIISNNTITELPADKMPVGKGEINQSFNLYQVKPNKGDTLYFYTDGYADQFGGETGQKKLTRKRFKELILSVQHLPMEEQKQALGNFITDYRKQIEQIDDILVIGVRV